MTAKTTKKKITPAQMQERQEQKETIRALRKMLRPGKEVYCKIESVSRSGMTRWISFYVVHRNQLRCINYDMARITWYGRDNKHDGLKVVGCGMDMGFKSVYDLGRVLYPKGFKLPKGQYGRNGDKSGFDTDGGYALKHRWI